MANNSAAIFGTYTSDLQPQFTKSPWDGLKQLGNDRGFFFVRETKKETRRDAVSAAGLRCCSFCQWKPVVHSHKHMIWKHQPKVHKSQISGWSVDCYFTRKKTQKEAGLEIQLLGLAHEPFCFSGDDAHLAPGCKDPKCEEANLDDVKKAVDGSNLIIVCLGTGTRTTGDKTELSGAVARIKTIWKEPNNTMENTRALHEDESQLSSKVTHFHLISLSQETI